MKASCLTVILLLLSCSYCVRAQAVVDQKINLRESTQATWSGECVVNVYFVRNMFTANERQLLSNAIETWAQTAKKKGREIRFVLAGETGGLIDCLGCLTIAKQAFASQITKQRVSFNTLRQDDTGRLVSAWIGFEQSATAADLRILMIQTLERGLTSHGSQTAKGGR